MSLNLSDIAKKVKAATVVRWGESEWESMDNIIQHESGYEPCKINGGAIDCNYKGSRACGLGQFVPCSKLTDKCQLANVDCQVQAVIAYVSDRYQSPTLAWNHWQARVPVDGKDVGNWY